MPFEYQNNHLYLVHKEHRLNLLSLAEKLKKPAYVYDLDGLIDRLKFFKKKIQPAHTHYAIKANSHPKILKALCKENIGVDIVSGGELKIVLQAGFRGKDIMFSGVGKTSKEITEALKADILQFNVESISELKQIAKIAKDLCRKAKVAFRINPNIDLDTHSYIKTSLREHKFGMGEESLPELKEIVHQHSSQLLLHGLTMHLGSQIFDLTPIKSGIEKMLSIYEELQKEFDLKTLDIGGGLGINYKSMNYDGDIKIIEEYGAHLKKICRNFRGTLLTEPGRIIVGRFACLITQIQYLKSNPHKNFVILDTGMHHLIRPSLYQSYHRILPIVKRAGKEKTYDVVGPICESSDVLGEKRNFGPLREKDFMAILDAGAYGSVMASTYNAMELPEEIIISVGHQA